MLSTALLPGTLRAAAGWASSGHGTPGTPWTVSDDRSLKRPATLWDRMTQAAGRTACCLSQSMHLNPLRCHLTPRTAALPVGPHRAAAGSLACSCRAECRATEHGHRQFPVPRLAAAAASRSPTRVPAATASLSAMSARRFTPCRIRWWIEDTQLAPHFPMTLRNPTQRDGERGQRHGTITPAKLRQCLAHGNIQSSRTNVLKGCQRAQEGAHTARQLLNGVVRTVFSFPIRKL
ncbi:hypothetical protein TCDM_10121 [Trypanosoma cruzi Dm28c]|uniref:Uncharacterized protein n=1 Tax=Trypanosoma cruzi Dm28c TaxID=1416333 RepID=V5BCW0_TRYCR|nr:hypothetical protein TCDM_10121 [Trypanosoma cruzi Dm28c]